MPTYESALAPPYPAFLSDWPAPWLVRDVDRSLFSWLNTAFDLDLHGFSTEELVFVLREHPAFNREVAAVLAHIDSLRTSIQCLQNGGFGAVLAEFEAIAGSAGRPEDTIRRLYATLGGVMAVTEGRGFLAIPCPGGQWAVTDGTRLQRLWESPFATAAFPLS